MNNYNFAADPIKLMKKSEERSRIRQSAMFIGIAMIMVVVVTFVWAPIYLRLMTLFGIGTDEALAIIDTPMVQKLVDQVLSMLMFTLPFLLILSGCGHRLRDVVSMSRPRKEFFLPLILIGIAFCGFANIAGSVLISVIESFGVRVPSSSYELQSGISGFLMTFLSTAVVAPLTEEFAMRGIVMGTLKKHGEGFAICISAVLFGLMHADLRQIPFAFIVGLALGFAVIKTGSLWAGVLIHALNNGIVTVMNYATVGLSPLVQNIITCVYFVACLLCAFIGVALLSGRSREAAELEAPDSVLSARQSATTFFTSPVILIYLVLVAIETALRL